MSGPLNQSEWESSGTGFLYVLCRKNQDFKRAIFPSKRSFFFSESESKRDVFSAGLRLADMNVNTLAACCSNWFHLLGPPRQTLLSHQIDLSEDIQGRFQP